MVGRTGAGKSSLFQALFRIIDPLDSGHILIDDINISLLSLNVLRYRVHVCIHTHASSQISNGYHPSGSLPLQWKCQRKSRPMQQGTAAIYNYTLHSLCLQCSEYEMWSALERCHLKTVVENMGMIMTTRHVT